MIGLIVPTLNAGSQWSDWIALLKSQSLQPDRVLVVDSSSDDQTIQLARQAGFEVLSIQRSDFNHGATRQLAANHLSDAEILIYLTQDALLADNNALKYLVEAFSNPLVGAAYGRQLPHLDAGVLGAHARDFNYGAKSEVRSMKDIPVRGLKTVFISNSFSAYRKSALMAVGGFPANVILGEDTFVVSKMVLAGWEVAYCAEAKVRHSHDYTIVQEFKRYFDTGVFHGRETWIRQAMGGADGEGKRFVLSELRCLVRKAPWLIPSALLRTGMKYLGYKLGMMENKIPLSIKRRLSMHKRYWN